MKYVYWNSDGDPADYVLKEFEAADINDAVQKAAWLMAGDIGDQYEYDFALAIKCISTDEVFIFDVRIVYENPRVDIDLRR